MSWAPPTWGEVGDDELVRILIVSPHLDDAAMGAAHVITSHPDVTVATVFTASPPTYPDPLPDWDTQGGFSSGDDVMAARREEDRAAMAVLGAETRWLGHVEGKYLERSTYARPEQVAASLERTIDELHPTAVFLPMGLANPEHVVTHAAGRLILDRRPELAWFAYSDAGYVHIPGMLAWRVSTLFHDGLWPTPAMVPISPDDARKRRAVECYTSQLPPLINEHALSTRLGSNVAEQHWRLAPPPQGWEGMASRPAGA